MTLYIHAMKSEKERGDCMTDLSCQQLYSTDYSNCTTSSNISTEKQIVAMYTLQSAITYNNTLCIRTKIINKVHIIFIVI